MLRLGVIALVLGFLSNAAVVVSLSLTVPLWENAPPRPALRSGTGLSPIEVSIIPPMPPVKIVHNNGRSYISAGTWAVETKQRFGSMQVRADADRWVGFLIVEILHGAIEPIALSESPLPAPVRRHLDTAVPYAGNDMEWGQPRVIREYRGWPLYAAWCEYLHRPYVVIQDRVQGGISLEYEQHPSNPLLSGSVPLLSSGIAIPSWFTTPLPRSIPYRPLWSGVMLNTLFHGCVLLSLMLLARHARQRWRLHRSRCPSCNYMLTPNPTPGCPECGWHRPAEEGEPPASPESNEARLG